ncbi:hypothetical protein WR25_05249 [Diploscapter pachys]|uniref:Uncharacterized protein n=1 Tax=Diploscapter pachys TaxID=2018661 RepID=A0A2A2M396_9BILA|nr:hypothetical protein WR25_05249 [Diploscapter pachys]
MKGAASMMSRRLVASVESRWSRSPVVTAGEAIVRAVLHHLAADAIGARVGDGDADDAEQIGHVAPARGDRQRHALDLGERGQGARDVDDVPRRTHPRDELVLAAVHRRIGGEQPRGQREGRGADTAGAGDADRLADARIGRPDVGDGEVGRHLHARVDVAHGRAAHVGDIDAREIERLAALLVAECPGVGAVVRLPFEVDLAVDEIEPIEPALAPQERQWRDPRVDPRRVEQIGAAGPGGVGDRHPLGDELDLERREIELEVAVDPHCAMRLAADESFEGRAQEAALGDIEHQPDRDDQRDDREHDVARDSPRTAAARGQDPRAPSFRFRIGPPSLRFACGGGMGPASRARRYRTARPSRAAAAVHACS